MGEEGISISTYSFNGDLFARAGAVLMVGVVLENFIDEDINGLRDDLGIPE